MANFDRSKPHINVGTMGHVDHGKTTLTAAITNESTKLSLTTKLITLRKRRLAVSPSPPLTKSMNLRSATTLTSICRATPTTSRT